MAESYYLHTFSNLPKIVNLQYHIYIKNKLEFLTHSLTHSF